MEIIMTATATARNFAPIADVIAGSVLLKSGFEPVLVGSVPFASEQAANAQVKAVAPQSKLTLSRVRRIILSSYMASSAGTAFRKFPYAASNTDFSEFGYENETSKTLNKALRTGGRGLSDNAEYCDFVDSLPSYVAPSLRSYIDYVLVDRAPLAKLIVKALHGLDKIAA